MVEPPVPHQDAEQPPAAGDPSFQYEHQSLEISRGVFPVRDIQILYDLDPSLADRALAILEMEQARQAVITQNQIQLAQVDQREQYRATARGTYIGSAVVSLFGILAALLIFAGHDIAGGVFGSLDIVAVLSIYIGNPATKPKEDQQPTPS